ncbi:MAG TPA: histidine kinase [Candidatus Butyricimonas faecavium]|nr:histidine kinase [Candidatus Butyricimonas faecavium]
MRTFKGFILKCVLFLIPFFILAGFYFYDDPFKVVREYKKYDNDPIFLNEDYIGWKTYKNYRDSLHFDSFILGNSCTMAFLTSDWEKYLNGKKAIRLYGTAQRLAAVHRKIIALDKEQNEIANVLLIVDPTLLREHQLSNGYMHLLPPEISGMNKFKFQSQFVQEFFNPKFIIPYIDYRICRHYRPYMKGIVNPDKNIRNTVTNDLWNPREEEIATLGDYYWEKYKKRFRPRSGQNQTYPPVLMKPQVKLLSEIAKVFQAHHTNCKIIVSPEYKQIRMNPADVEQLKNIFGAKNVYDFSGINQYTNDIRNYYDGSHYRPCLGQKLLDRVYATHEPTN